MAEYPGANSNATMGANLKEVYPKKKRFKKVLQFLGK